MSVGKKPHSPVRLVQIHSYLFASSVVKYIVPQNLAPEAKHHFAGAFIEVLGRRARP